MCLDFTIWERSLFAWLSNVLFMLTENLKVVPLKAEFCSVRIILLLISWLSHIFLLMLWLIFFFSEKRWKDNITFHDDNNTVSYMEYRQYFFEESMSVGDESDVVTIPNMLVLVRIYDEIFSPLCRVWNRKSIPILQSNTYRIYSFAASHTEQRAILNGVLFRIF